jgi:hypothetical protein
MLTQMCSENHSNLYFKFDEKMQMLVNVWKRQYSISNIFVPERPTHTNRGRMFGPSVLIRPFVGLLVLPLLLVG